MEKKESFKSQKDDLGRIVNFKSNPKRVMALTSSLTETLFLICPDSEIVGRTQNCNFPVAVLKKPVVNNYPIDYEKLLLLNPDIVLAKDGIISLEQASKIQDMGIPVYFQQYQNMEDIFSGIEELGLVLGKKQRAEFVADSLRREVVKLSETLNKMKRPKVLVIISLDQIFVFGKDSYVSDVIEAAGGTNAINEVFNNPFPQVTTEYIMDIDPDLLVVLDEKDKSRIDLLYPELAKIKAIKNRNVFFLSEDLISRPGPRIVQAVQCLNKFIGESEINKSEQ